MYGVLMLTCLCPRLNNATPTLNNPTPTLTSPMSALSYPMPTLSSPMPTPASPMLASGNLMSTPNNLTDTTSNLLPTLNSSIAPPTTTTATEVQSPSNVLRFTIYNVIYRITTDVIHKICIPHAMVVRIVISYKDGNVQAMVEFPTVDDATRTKERLDGADIYAGCCTLKIEYCKPQVLSVRVNNDETWDVNLVGQELLYQSPGEYTIVYCYGLWLAL